MFTEGLDERAISWIKEGSEVAQQTRSPLIEKYPLDSITNRPLLPKCSSLLSPKGLPPVKYHSGLLGPRPGYLLNSEGEEESVDSTPEDAYDNYSDTCEEGLGSSDSDLFSKPIMQCFEEEIVSGKILMCARSGNSDNKQHRALVRGNSKENLRVEVAGYDICRDDKLGNKVHPERSSMVHHLNGCADRSFCDLGTPSAPPIAENGRDEGSLDVEVDMKSKVFESTGGLSDFAQSQKFDAPQERSVLAEGDPQVPIRQINLEAQTLNYSTSAQNAWQTFIAYDACFRLCLNAWARNCMEAPEFLRDECMALRSAFGIQNFLLQPRGHIGLSSMQNDNKEISNTIKGKKMIGQLEVEVKRVRIIPRRRKLHSTSSYRAMYIQAGAEYVKHVSSVIKSQINSLKAASFAVAPEESVSCWLKLKSSSDDESGSHVCMRPGTGDSHIFYPESEGDALLAEVHINKVNQGCAAIQISQLADGTGESTKWWPIYNEEHDCVGKVHLSISITSSSDRRNLTKMLQGGPVVETMIYDLVLEAAMRAEQFQQKNLTINGVWKWLLNEFADYYGVSAAYTKLRYLSYIMNVATPTKECLELIYDLLLPIVRARGDKSLTRQERSILFDCEYQIRNLLATVFHNYKSLDEFSTTGITDILGPIPDSAAPAIAPAVQIFTLLHDILSQETQNILRNYFQTAAAKRCRRHMLETDEFMSNNCDGVLADPITISTAYMKMKTLCKNISNEIQADIKIHNQHILPSSIDLPNITASLYSTELSKRLRGFLAACPPSRPSHHVAELLIATADFESDLDSWNIRPVHGGVVSRDLFHDYINVWIQETRLHLLEMCKSEKMSYSAGLTGFQTSPFAEHMYEEISKSITEYEVVINRWPQYLLTLENVVADVERAIVKELEKCYSDTLMPLKDGIPKILEKQMQKLKRRQSASSYVVPNQLGTFLNTLKRILDVLHSRVEETLKGWASYLTISDGNTSFGEQLNGVTVLLKKKYKKYTQGVVSKLVDNTQANRTTRLKRTLEDTKEAEGEAEIRDRMQALCTQLADSVHNLHQVFSSRIFVAICRGLWDRMGQIVLSFLESRKENRIWYKASDYALGILDDLFASEMQKVLGNSLQDKDLDPPRSVNEARSILS